MQGLKLIKSIIELMDNGTTGMNYGTGKVVIEVDGDDYEITEENIGIDVNGNICIKIDVPKCPCCEEVDQ